MAKAREAKYAIRVDRDNGKVEWLGLGGTTDDVEYRREFDDAESARAVLDLCGLYAFCGYLTRVEKLK